MSTTSCERCEDFAADALKVLSQRCAPDERHCSCVPHLRAEIDRLTAERAALLAPVDRINEDLGVLANMACEDPKHNDLWCPTCEEYPTIRALAREAIHRRAELEEARLTLAAEQGRAEGAPSEGWTYGIIDDEGGRGWRKPWRQGMMFAWGIGCYVSSSAVVTPHPGGWSRWRYNDDGELDEEVEYHTDEAWSARAAMLAADASK